MEVARRLPSCGTERRPAEPTPPTAGIRTSWTDIAGTQSATSAQGRVYLDRTLSYAITWPGPTQTLSNVYQGSSSDFTVTGTARENNLTSWTLDYGAGSSPTAWTIITWERLPSSVGPWGLVDLGAGQSALHSPVNCSRFRSQCRRDDSDPHCREPDGERRGPPVQRGERRYHHVHVDRSFSLTETLKIKTFAGAPVRTLVSILRAAGTYNDQYDPSADPDGTYLYTVDADDGAGHAITLDRSNLFVNGYSAYNDGLVFSAYDPFNNRPLSFSYNFAQPGQVTIGLSPYSPVPANCNPPNFCIYNRKFDASGPHTITWAGVDSTGAFRPDIKSIGVVTDQATFPKSAVVVFGRTPVVSNVQVTPAYYAPANGSQTVSFTLATYRSQPAAVTVSFLNQNSLSTLRTITIPSQGTPGM